MVYAFDWHEVNEKLFFGTNGHGFGLFDVYRKTHSFCYIVEAVNRGCSPSAESLNNYYNVISVLHLSDEFNKGFSFGFQPPQVEEITIVLKFDFYAELVTDIFTSVTDTGADFSPSTKTDCSL